MNKHDSEPLFTEFPPIAKSEWLEKINKDLKGADFEEKLVWKTTEGFTLQPFYTQEDLRELSTPERFQNQDLNTAQVPLGARQWENRPEIVVEDLKKANQMALEALNNGADGIAFNLSAYASPIDFSTLLAEIQTRYCGISFLLKEGFKNFVQEYLGYITQTGQEVTQLNGCIHTSTTPSPDDIKALMNSPARDSSLRFIPINLPTLPDTVSERVATLLFKATTILNTLIDQGCQIEHIVPHISFSFPVSNNYFFEMAGLRALRTLFYEMIKEYGVKDYPAHRVYLHVRSSIRTDYATEEEHYTNLLANTTQAMSAIIGGCNALTVTPHDADLKVNNRFSCRIARNVSTVLREEAYFDKVADPAAGSYYLETLSYKIAEKAWSRFQEML
ncbi:methylmalonyl-CoA mutase family protein [Rapidithrix thailandica]|uniref:Methylmalonyl-CoA mutase family protein n=1 Tax=Rapidithrix thailandica TaxID=413964 RepID=A0AAW9S6D8_9BACT